MENIILHTPTFSKAIKALVKESISHYDFMKLSNMITKGHRITLVGIPNTMSGELKVGLSICSYPDNFEKKKGVLIATERAFYEPYCTLYLNDNIHSYKACLKSLQDLHAVISCNIDKAKRVVGGKSK